MERGDVCKNRRTTDECEIDEEKNGGQEYEPYYVEDSTNDCYENSILD